MMRVQSIDYELLTACIIAITPRGLIVNQEKIERDKWWDESAEAVFEYYAAIQRRALKEVSR